jgi:hypothetical protein
VRLDAGGSTDPEGEPMLFTWSGPFGTATGPAPTVDVPLGAWTIGLTVTDARGATSEDSVTIAVLDQRAPSLRLAPVPDLLWPPNGEMTRVDIEVQMHDLCDPAPRGILRSVVILDPSNIDRALDVADADLGTEDRSVLLRVIRSEGGSGRIYALVYNASDASGNYIWRTALVRVPVSQGG